MAGFPGSPIILKGAFVRYDGSAASPRIIIFPYNPETLTRTILPNPAATASSQLSQAAGAPQETIVFTLTLDATNALEQANAQAASIGVYPVLSALELLMYPPQPGADLVTLFAWGPNRIVPVRVTALNIVENAFGTNLSPYQVSVQVTLSVTPADEMPSLGYLLQHVALLNTFAGTAYSNQPAEAGDKTAAAWIHASVDGARNGSRRFGAVTPASVGPGLGRRSRDRRPTAPPWQPLQPAAARASDAGRSSRWSGA